MSTPITLAAQIHALRTLIEYREQVGPRVYIAADLYAALQAGLLTLEELKQHIADSRRWPNAAE